MSEKEKGPEKKTAQRTVLKSTEMDSKFKYQVSKIPGAERIMLCFQCGTCTADCPVARFSETYRPRQIMRMTQLGLKNRVLSSDVIWLCAACFTCVDHCPQNVEIAAVLRALRNMAVEEGYMPSVFKELASSVQATGLAYRIPELRLKKREETGLPPLPKTNINDVAKLFEAVGFFKKLEGRKQ